MYNVNTVLEHEISTTKRFKLDRRTVNIMVSTNVHEAIKAYAYSRNMKLREATEYLLSLSLYMVEHKEDDK